jgi:hypothetical protein
LTLGTVAVDGVFTPAVTGLTAGGSLELVVGGDLTITQSISASGQTVRLASTGGGVSESGSATITAGTLGVRAGGGNIAVGEQQRRRQFGGVRQRIDHHREHQRGRDRRCDGGREFHGDQRPVDDGGLDQPDEHDGGWHHGGRGGDGGRRELA